MRQLLKDLAVICAGQGAPQGDNNYCENGTPFVKAGNLQELLEGKAITSIQKVSDEVAKKHKLKLYPKGTILFAKSGMSCMKGYVYVLPQSAYVVSHLACVTPNEDASEYLRYFFNYHKPNQLVKDAAYPSISLSDIGNLVVDMKSESERNAIVSVLQHAESVITLRQKELQKLDDLVKARFVELFGGIHDSKMYPYKLVNDLTDVISGGTPSRDVNEYWEGGTIPWVKTTELQNNYVTEVEEYITEEGLNNSSAKIVPAGTVLIAMYGQGKTRGMTAYLGIEACTNQACACILPSDKINQTFLWQFFVLSYDNLRDRAKGGNQPNLNGNIIKNYPVLYPPIELQEQFAAFVKQTDKSKVVVQKALDGAQTLFESLMQEYFG